MTYNNEKMNQEQLQQLKADYIRLLQSTHREGIESVITWMQSDQCDFFNAPASTQFHGDYPGGLLEHSMNVAKIAIDLLNMMTKHQPDLANTITRENVLIATLLHDICKANIYMPARKKRQNAQGIWECFDTYSVDYSQLPLGHGEKSVILLLQLGLKLTQDEILAIRWHMTAWDLPFQSAEAKSNLNAAKEKCPLLTIVQAADGLAAGILETIRK